MTTNWQIRNNSMYREFKFKDFLEALNFVNKVAGIAERQNHHPDICIKNYNEVTVSTTTHDQENAITAADYSLVDSIDKLT